MRWSVDTAEVRPARKSRHAMFQLLKVSATPDWDADGGMRRESEKVMLAEDSYYSESACTVLASFYV